MTTPRGAKFRLLAIGVLIMPLLVASAEFAVRIFSERINPLTVFVTSPRLRSDLQGETAAAIFEFDPMLSWRLKANLRDAWWDFTPVTTNAQHVRMARDIGARNGIRIVVLGDSVAFGCRVPVAEDRRQPAHFDPAEKPYAVLLESALREKTPGRQIEIIPLTCPGYTSGQGLAWLRRDIAPLSPDIVVACFGSNDVRADGLPDRATMPDTAARIFARRLIGSSQLLLNLAAAAEKRQPTPLNPPEPEPRSSEAEYVANFVAMASACREHHAWFGILMPVYRDANSPGIDPHETIDPAEGKRMTLYRDRLREAAKANNIPALEIPELTERSWPGNRSLFAERIHPNAAGHRLIAERLAAFLATPLRLEK